MLDLNIPGLGEMHIEYLVLDYNGTLAMDGKPLPGVLERLEALSQVLQIYVLTADTHGGARVALGDVPVTLVVLGADNQPEQKQAYVNELGPAKTIAIGNGYNDHLMLREAVLGMAVLEKEGLASAALRNADLIFGSITDALDSLLHPLRLAATLRR